MAQKIVITKAGFNALTESDNRNKIFDSDLNHLKTAQSGTMSLAPAANSTVPGTATHSLGYRPLVMAYFRTSDDANKWYISMTQPEITQPRELTDLNVEIISGTTDVVFNALNDTASAGTVDIQYEIFYEGG